MAIDDPVAAVEEAWPEPPGAVANAALAAVGAFFPPAGLVAALAQFFSQRRTTERLIALFRALNSKVDIQGKQIASLEEAEIHRRGETREFRAALEEAAAFTLLSSDPNRIARVGGALGTAVTSPDWDAVAADLRNFIHALAELTDEDVTCLRLIGRVFADVAKSNPNLNNQNAFTEKMDALRAAVDKSGIHRDDFYSACRRLEGRGLVMEALRNTSRMGLDDYCFRPTRRGLRLLALIDAESDATR